MAIEVRSINQALSKGNFVFTFSGNVLDFSIGVAYWYFTYPDRDHQVKKLDLSYTVDAMNGKTVSIKLNADLSNDGDAHIDTANSNVTLCCIAVTDVPDDYLTLGNYPDLIANKDTSADVPVVAGEADIEASYLRGWKLEYSKNHRVKQVNLGADLTDVAATSARILATANIYDNTGHSGETRSIVGGLLKSSNHPGLLVGVTTATMQSSSADVEVSFADVLPAGKTLGAAIVLLRGYNVGYTSGDDHNIHYVGGGAKSWTVKDTSVVLSKPWAFVHDSTGNHESDGRSNVSFLVLGIPK